MKKLVQVTDGLTDSAVRHREVRSLVEGAARFPEAETLLVANVLPPDDAGELGVNIVPLWRMLVGETPATEPRAVESASQVVLQHLRECGRVTRREVAALCGLSPQQASRLLNGLLEKGQITRHGVGRGTWYALSAAGEPVG